METGATSDVPDWEKSMFGAALGKDRTIVAEEVAALTVPR